MYLVLNSDDFKQLATSQARGLVDNLIYDGGGPVFQYEIVNRLDNDSGEVKYLNVKVDDMSIEVYFPVTTTFDYFDKETDTIEVVTLVDWTNFDRLSLQMEHRDFVR